MESVSTRLLMSQFKDMVQPGHDEVRTLLQISGNVVHSMKKWTVLRTCMAALMALILIALIWTWILSCLYLAKEASETTSMEYVGITYLVKHIYVHWDRWYTTNNRFSIRALPFPITHRLRPSLVGLMWNLGKRSEGSYGSGNWFITHCFPRHLAK